MTLVGKKVRLTRNFSSCVRTFYSGEIVRIIDYNVDTGYTFENDQKQVMFDCGVDGFKLIDDDEVKWYLIDGYDNTIHDFNTKNDVLKFIDDIVKRTQCIFNREHYFKLVKGKEHRISFESKAVIGDKND